MFLSITDMTINHYIEFLCPDAQSEESLHHSMNIYYKEEINTKAQK